MPSQDQQRARECVRLAYDHLVMAGHYAPLSPIRTAQTLVLEVLVALYDLQVGIYEQIIDEERENSDTAY